MVELNRIELYTDNVKTLIENNFKKISDTEYIYRFPVYKYKKRTLVWCSLTADISELIIILEVKDSNNNTYSSYYDRTYGGRNLVLEEIDKKIKKEIDKLKKNKIIYDKKDNKTQIKKGDSNDRDTRPRKPKKPKKPTNKQPRENESAARRGRPRKRKSDEK